MNPHLQPVKVAVLDDYQGVALQLADWSALRTRAEVTVFNDHLASADAVVERLLPFDVVCVMRERTPLRRAVIERLPTLKLIASTGKRNASIDADAANERGIAVVHTSGTRPPPSNSPGRSFLPAPAPGLRACLAAQRRLAAIHRGRPGRQTLGILGLAALDLSRQVGLAFACR